MATVVVLLHGLSRTRLSMRYLGRYLSQRGFAVLNLGYPSRAATIDDHVAKIEQDIRRAGLHGHELSFVTHSLGGIVLRGLVESHHADYRFGRAVMLGPPNQGSAFARALQARLPWLHRVLGPSYLEVASIQRSPGTDRLTVGIIAGTRTPERGYSPFVSGPNDGIVAVQETALPGATDTLVVRGLHSFLMYQPSILEQVAHFLAHGRFQRD